MLDFINGTYDFEDTAQAELLGGHMIIYDLSERKQRSDLESLLGDKPSFIVNQADAADFAALMSDLASAKTKAEKAEIADIYSQMYYGSLSGKLAKLAEALRAEDDNAVRNIVHEIFAA